YYWGHAAAVVDVVPLCEQAGLAAEGDFRYALRGRDGTGADGPVFLGAPALFDDATALRLDIVVPGGKWQMAARWRDAGAAAGWRAWPWHALALVLSALTTGLVVQVLRSQQRLSVLASHDSLTGLANRRHFLDMAEAYRALAERQQRQFVLLNLDLEDFKCINDDFGHEVGDAMLVHVAGQARGCLRASDLISRFGGDEFLVLLPDMAPGEELDQLVARLREAVAVPLPVNGRSLRVGLTIGMASFPAHGRSLPELMRAADAQMYESKRQRGPRARR
ncbi:MAG: GGDEF domain-containing protein, partial [Moraxellaceae bacterium]